LSCKSRFIGWKNIFFVITQTPKFWRWRNYFYRIGSRSSRTKAVCATDATLHIKFKLKPTTVGFYTKVSWI
jgi:hypothetical protein